MTETQIDILKTAMDWAKAEMFSSAFFAVFGVFFCLASYCFWQFGKTDTAKAYVVPLLVVGALLIILGVGLVLSNQWRLSGFQDAFQADQGAFISAELARADKTIAGYNKAVFIFIPGIILIAALVLIFVKTPIWTASMVSIITMMAVILMVDSNANARLAVYKTRLIEAEQLHTSEE